MKIKALISIILLLAIIAAYNSSKIFVALNTSKDAQYENLIQTEPLSTNYESYINSNNSDDQEIIYQSFIENKEKAEFTGCDDFTEYIELNKILKTGSYYSLSEIENALYDYTKNTLNDHSKNIDSNIEYVYIDSDADNNKQLIVRIPVFSKHEQYRVALVINTEKDHLKINASYDELIQGTLPQALV